MLLAPQKQAGLCLHLTSLPGDYGIGEIGHNALKFIDTLSSMKLAVWQILTTGPTAHGDSPYQALSAFAANELLIDVERLIQLGLLKPAEVAVLRDLPQDSVDYGRLIPLKNALLDTAAGRFWSVANSELKSDYEQYLENNDQRWLHDYALFRVLKTRHGEKPWVEWEQSFAHRDEASMTGLENDAGAQIAHKKVLQFLFHHQWCDLHDYATDMGVSVFGDMPIYIALDSADAWAHPELLRIDSKGQMDYVAGVPSDFFSKDGQLWGNPLYDWEHHAASGFAWWIERLRQSITLVDLVRIDHFRGFESFWAIPADSDTASQGEWQDGPGETFFKAIHDALGELPIVAEDLGAITPEVEAIRDRYRIPGMIVLQFDITKDSFDIANIAEDRICYTGTHDNDTTVGWFHGNSNDTRTQEEIVATQETVLDLTHGHPDTIHNDLIRFAFASNAKLAIIPMQDYLGLGSDTRLNTPGTVGDNWRWRLLPTQLTPQICADIGEMIAKSGRAGTPLTTPEKPGYRLHVTR